MKYYDSKQDNKQKKKTKQSNILNQKSKKKQEEKQEPDTEMRNRKEGRKIRTRERDKEREIEKGGGAKTLKRNKGRHRKNTPKCALLGYKQVFLVKPNKRKAKKNKTTKINKEGLGPSEVALWATSPDP